MGLLLLAYVVIQHPVLALVPLILVVWSLAVVETHNEEYGDFVK